MLAVLIWRETGAQRADIYAQAWRGPAVRQRKGTGRHGLAGRIQAPKVQRTKKRVRNWWDSTVRVEERTPKRTGQRRGEKEKKGVKAMTEEGGRLRKRGKQVGSRCG